MLFILPIFRLLFLIWFVCSLDNSFSEVLTWIRTEQGKFYFHSFIHCFSFRSILFLIQLQLIDTRASLCTRWNFETLGVVLWIRFYKHLQYPLVEYISLFTDLWAFVPNFLILSSFFTSSSKLRKGLRNFSYSYRLLLLFLHFPYYF